MLLTPYKRRRNTFAMLIYRAAKRTFDVIHVSRAGRAAVTHASLFDDEPLITTVDADIISSSVAPAASSTTKNL